MPILPESVPAADLATCRVARELDGPRPPVDPLARLIQSSYANQDHTDPASVRMAYASELARRLIRHRKQVLEAPDIWITAYADAGYPNIVQRLTRQIHRLQQVA